MSQQNSLLAVSLKDLFTVKMIKYSILPVILSMLIMYLIFFVVAGIGLEQLGSMDIQSSQTTIENGVPHTDSFTASLEGTALIQFLMSHAITSWIATFLVYSIGSFLVLYFSIFIALIIIGFLTPTILRELQRRHYPDVEMIGHSNIFESIFLLSTWLLIMLIMFIAFIPLYFLPIIGLIMFNLPLYYFFHKVITYDVASNICTKDEAAKIKFFNATTLRIKTLGLYLISLIPFVVFFASVFFIIYLGHSYFSYTRSMRA